MAILVDTGALELLRRRDREVESMAIRFYPPIICCHVAAEFLFGQILSKVPSSTLLRAREFLDSFEMLTPKRSTAGEYARIRASLKVEGRIIPTPTIGSRRTQSRNRFRCSPLTPTSRTSQIWTSA